MLQESAQTLQNNNNTLSLAETSETKPNAFGSPNKVHETCGPQGQRSQQVFGHSDSYTDNNRPIAQTVQTANTINDQDQSMQDIGGHISNQPEQCFICMMVQSVSIVSLNNYIVSYSINSKTIHDFSEEILYSIQLIKAHSECFQNLEEKMLTVMQGEFSAFEESLTCNYLSLWLKLTKKLTPSSDVICASCSKQGGLFLACRNCAKSKVHFACALKNNMKQSQDEILGWEKLSTYVCCSLSNHESKENELLSQDFKADLSKSLAQFKENVFLDQQSEQQANAEFAQHPQISEIAVNEQRDTEFECAFNKEFFQESENLDLNNEPQLKECKVTEITSKNAVDPLLIDQSHNSFKQFNSKQLFLLLWFCMVLLWLTLIFDQYFRDQGEQDNCKSKKSKSMCQQILHEISKPITQNFFQINESAERLHDLALSNINPEEQKLEKNVRISSTCENGFQVLGKRTRRAPQHLQDLTKEEVHKDHTNQKRQKLISEFPQSIQICNGNAVAQANNKSSSDTSAGASQHEAKPPSNYQVRQQTEADPFCNPTINEVFKPIMAIDKLSIMRRDKQCFEILLHVKDLKALTKERRSELIASCERPPSNDAITDQHSDQNDEEMADEDKDEDVEMQAASDNEKNDKKMQEESFQQANNRKRKKRKTNLTQASSRSKINATEISWIDNTLINKQILEKRKHQVVEKKKQKIEQMKLGQKSSIETFSEGETNVEIKTLDIEERYGKQEPKTQQYIYKSKDMIESIDDLYEKYNSGYYHNIDSLESDLSNLVAKMKRTRCKNELACKYLDQILQSALSMLNKKKTDFLTKWRHYFEEKFQANQNFSRVQSWYKAAGPRRQYNYINDYKVVTSLNPKERLALSKAINLLSCLQDSASRDDQCMLEEMQRVTSIKRNITNQSNLGNDKQIIKIAENTSQFSDEFIESLDAQTKEQIFSVKNKEEFVLSKMRTDKKATCTGSCCTPPQNQGSDITENFEKTLTIEALDNEKSMCNCIRLKVECGADCGCDPELCRNRQMTLKRALVEGIDFEERTAWGIDLCTAMNLLDVLPRDIPLNQKSFFLEKRLLFAIQQQGESGYNIIQALQFIIDQPLTLSEQHNLNYDGDTSFNFTIMEKELAKITMNAILNLKTKNEEHFRVHSKGLGIFCKRKEGIPPSGLVVEYFGEIYPLWLWYEKQDVLKQGQNRGTLSKELPDFYNITYERHLDDPTGYDILMVDPILYGNHSSRLSHSCSPNCQTIIKVKQDNKMYSIGMFSSKRIFFGEELCFNYCSVTESEKEYEAASCLCGTVNCTGRFLQLSSERKQMQIMKNHHTFIDRNFILFKAIEEWQQNKQNCLTQEDQIILKEFGLKDSALKGTPGWLRKWASYVCQYIKFEESIYPTTFKEDYPNVKEELIKLDAKNMRDVKLSNVAITIDKVKRVLESMGGIEEPPLRKLSSHEIFKKLWCRNDSFKSALVEVLNTIEENYAEEVGYCFSFIKSLDEQADIISDQKEELEDQYSDLLITLRYMLYYISQTLRGIKSQTVAIQALCDTLVMYSKTETYFTSTDYPRVKGEEVSIRKCDVNMDISSRTKSTELAVKDQSKALYKGVKEYDPSYIWGQLIGWYKQTVDKPNASLSADRRGTVSMPDIESFLITAKNQEGLNSGIKRSKKKKNRDKSSSESEEIMPTKTGSRSRPGRNNQSVTPSAKTNNKLDDCDNINGYKVPEGKEVKIVYPNKKHQSRKAFLENWQENFSKPFDVICHWSFKNKNKLYGSIQFESLVKADKLNDKSLQGKLSYFNDVVSLMQQYSND